MNSIHRSGLAALAVATFATLAPAPVLAAKCVTAGGQGTGLTPDIARTMATAALNNSITSYGGKAKGKVAMTCNAALVLTECTAKQRACK